MRIGLQYRELVEADGTGHVSETVQRTKRQIRMPASAPIADCIGDRSWLALVDVLPGTWMGAA